MSQLEEEEHNEQHDDHHVLLFGLIGVFAAVLILLPQLWFASKRKED